MLSFVHREERLAIASVLSMRFPGGISFPLPTLAPGA